MNCTRKFRCDGVMYMIKVLLADDQELIRESLGFVLGAQGDITVVGMAKNGREAIELVRSEKPDVVLMDIRMPVMDGLEATRRIRSVSADVPIIAMSAYSSGSEIESARNAGCNEFLVKPLSQYSLHRALNAALVELKGKGKS